MGACGVVLLGCCRHNACPYPTLHLIYVPRTQQHVPPRAPRCTQWHYVVRKLHFCVCIIQVLKHAKTTRMLVHPSDCVHPARTTHTKQCIFMGYTRTQKTNTHIATKNIYKHALPAPYTMCRNIQNIFVLLCCYALIASTQAKTEHRVVLSVRSVENATHPDRENMRLDPPLNISEPPDSPPTLYDDRHEMPILTTPEGMHAEPHMTPANPHSIDDIMLESGKDYMPEPMPEPENVTAPAEHVHEPEKKMPDTKPPASPIPTVRKLPRPQIKRILQNAPQQRMNVRPNTAERPSAAPKHTVPLARRNLG